MLSVSKIKKVGCRYFCILLLFLSSCEQTNKDDNSNLKQTGLLNQAAALMGQYEYPAAVEILEKLQRQRPQNTRIKLDLAIATLNRQQDGDISYAIVLAEQVNNSQSDNARAKYLLGLLYLYQGAPSKALVFLSEVVKLSNDDAYVHYFYAQALEQLGENALAFRHYKRATELSPYLRSAIYAAAMTARKSGFKDQAKAFLKTYKRLKNNPRGLLAEYKYTRMGPLAELSSSDVVSKKLMPTTLNKTVWKLNAQWQLAGSSNFSVLQNIQPSFKTRIINFTSDTSTHTTNNEDVNIEIEQFDLEDVNTAALADINNDGLTDLVVCAQGQWQLFLQDLNKQWNKKNIFPEHQQQNCGDVKLFDADHDGDVDIYIANFSGADELFSNNGDLSFRPLSSTWTKFNQGTTLQIIPVDWDHDRDLDILLVKQNGNLLLLENQLLWNYQPKTIKLKNSAGIRKVLVFDLESDGNWELLTLEKNAMQLWQQQQDLQWRATKLTSSVASFDNFTLEDFDGDGLKEVILYGKQGILWQQLTAQKNTQMITEQAVSSLKIIAQENSSGPAIAAMVSSEAGHVLKIYSEIANTNTYSYIQLQGAENKSSAMRTNKQAIGAELRAKIGNRWIITTSFAANSMAGQDRVPRMISTLGNKQLDYVEVRWPDGVYQTELNLKSGSTVITETQRQLSSCPVLFVETDQGYQFVSDLLGVGGVGFLAEPGFYVESRPWEYLQLPQGLINKNSKIVRLKITEPMEENTYLDAVKLHRYRLPQQWHLVMDERMGVNSPLPTGEALFYRNSYQPDRATDAAANDVTQFLEKVDNQPIPLKKLHPKYIGLVAEQQQITLSFSILQQHSGNKEFGLVLDGWVEYPYSQTVFAAWQSATRYDPPTIEIKVKGEWQIFHSQIGYPAGMPRTSYIPLKGIPARVSEIRISTNLELYFDAIKLVEIEKPISFEHHIAEISSAKMEYIGFPQRTNAASNRPVYNYQKRTPYADMKTLTGEFTRFGEISELLTTEDNSFAIIGSGEAVAIEFVFADNDSTFDNEYYVLEARGYAKDMDLYTNTGGTVAPLPVTVINNQSNQKSNRLHRKYNTRYQDGW